MLLGLQLYRTEEGQVDFMDLGLKAHLNLCKDSNTMCYYIQQGLGAYTYKWQVIFLINEEFNKEKFPFYFKLNNVFNTYDAKVKIYSNEDECLLGSFIVPTGQGYSICRPTDIDEQILLKESVYSIEKEDIFEKTEVGKFTITMDYGTLLQGDTIGHRPFGSSSM